MRGGFKHCELILKPNIASEFNRHPKYGKIKRAVSVKVGRAKCGPYVDGEL